MRSVNSTTARAPSSSAACVAAAVTAAPQPWRRWDAGVNTGPTRTMPAAGRLRAARATGSPNASPHRVIPPWARRSSTTVGGSAVTPASRQIVDPADQEVDVGGGVATRAQPVARRRGAPLPRGRGDARHGGAAPRPPSRPSRPRPPAPRWPWARSRRSGRSPARQLADERTNRNVGDHPEHELVGRRVTTPRP